MESYKGILQSRTVWAGVVGLAGVLLKSFGYEISVGDQAALVEAIGTIMGVVGTVGSIWFRIHATKVIK